MNRFVRWSAAACFVLLTSYCGRLKPPAGPPDAGPSVLGLDAAKVEAGHQWVSNHGCAECHQASLAGSSVALPGTRAYAPNLTPDLETGLGRWTPAQVLDAVRLGLDDEGEALCVVMPRFPSLTATEGDAVVTYLRSLPPVSHEVPQSECDEDEAPGDGGAVLAQALGCPSCHSSPDAGAVAMAGDDDPLPGTDVYAPNLTPDPDTGLGAWSNDDIVRAIRQGVDDEGHALCATMPRFRGLTDADAAALVAWLRSLEPVHHAVPESVCAERPAPEPDGGPVDPDPDADAGTLERDGG